MSVRPQEYCTSEAFEHRPGMSGQVSWTLPAGSFVKPIELRWVPKHVLENRDFWYSPQNDIYVYCRFGIIPIPRRIVIKANA